MIFPWKHPRWWHLEPTPGLAVDHLALAQQRGAGGAVAGGRAEGLPGPLVPGALEEIGDFWLVILILMYYNSI